MNNEYSKVAQPAADAPPETQQEPTGGTERRLTTEQRIAKAQALNIIKDLANAKCCCDDKKHSGNTEKIGLTEEAGWVIIRDEVMHLAQGKAVDLSYLSPLVQAAIENGGTVVEVKDSNPEVEEEVEELNW